MVKILKARNRPLEDFQAKEGQLIEFSKVNQSYTKTPNHQTLIPQLVLCW